VGSYDMSKEEKAELVRKQKESVENRLAGE